ncbi:salivary peroxidase/catechol oxidase-like [Haliotis cracherodii]|uniref:salivary peroxidase/catechol oxidase-like n=1 Tax=Haliotis cracherodii TaxID=6455 RepID=UPI0039EC858A
MYVLCLLIASALLPNAETRGDAEHHVFVRDKRQSEECNRWGKYREEYNYCNNLKKPVWGSSYDKLARSLPPEYDDGKGTPRQMSVNGGLLPNPRTVSVTVHSDKSVLNNEHSLMLMQWGQFINHDMVGTPNTTDSEGDILDCCKEPTDVTTNPASECFSIFIPNQDRYYRQGRCMSFVRSEAVPGSGTNANPRLTYTTASAFIDGSHVYGPYPELEDALRKKTGGLLKFKMKNGKAFPPVGDPTACFNGNNPNTYCFWTGDRRANVFPGLTALHIAFMREHNRIARVLANRHPTWNDETLFKATKKIVIAELQVITYKQWLPLIIGPDYMKIYEINNAYQYQEEMNPRITNAFATSAMRFGHSMVPKNLFIGGQKKPVANLISNTAAVHKSMEDVLNSITGGVNERTDAWFSKDMTDFMFETAINVRDGYDIVSLNIQRGRDHGVPAYNKWRAYCKRPQIQSFYNNVFSNEIGRNLAKVYKSVNDIDLYSGSISEWNVPNGVVGDVNACLIGEQFMRIKYGDRFFWETENTRVGFTKEQRDQLKKVTLARIICDNTDIRRIQENVFMKPGTDNPRVSCSDIPRMDMTKF